MKWSGVYWIAAFGILTVIWDITARREAGIRQPILAVVRRDLWCRACGRWPSSRC